MFANCCLCNRYLVVFFIETTILALILYYKISAGCDEVEFHRKIKKKQDRLDVFVLIIFGIE